MGPVEKGNKESRTLVEASKTLRNYKKVATFEKTKKVVSVSARVVSPSSKVVAINQRVKYVPDYYSVPTPTQEIGSKVRSGQNCRETRARALVLCRVEVLARFFYSPVLPGIF